MSDISFVEYAIQAAETAIYPNAGKDMAYPSLGIKGEIGEVCEHLKKTIRDDGGVLTEARLGRLLKEMGDVAWYLAAIFRTLPESSAVSINLCRPAHGNQPIAKSNIATIIYHVDHLAHFASQLAPGIDGKCTSEELMNKCYTHWRHACRVMGFEPGVVLEENLIKLFDRMGRDVLRGSGDDR